MRSLIFGLTGLMILTVAVSAQAATPPAPDIRPELLTGTSPLLPMYQKQITARIDHWKKVLLLNPTTPKNILKAQQSIRSDFVLYPGKPKYQNFFATEAIKALLPIVEGKEMPAEDTLSGTRQINAAIALASMNTSAIQPAMQKMLVSKSQAVRMIAWKGYAKSLPVFLATGPKQVALFLGNLKKALATETNPVLIRQIYSVMILPKDIPGLSVAARKDLKAKLFPLLQASWTPRRKAVENATSRDALLPARRGLALAANLTTEANKKVVLQMTMDMAYSATLLYSKIHQEPTLETLLFSDISLLLACEEQLNFLSGNTKTLLKDIINTPPSKLADKTAALEEKVLDWSSALSKMGIKDPVAAAKAK